MYLTPRGDLLPNDFRPIVQNSLTSAAKATILSCVSHTLFRIAELLLPSEDT